MKKARYDHIYITVNIYNTNTFEKPVGAVIVNGSDGDIKDIIEIKKEEL